MGRVLCISSQTVYGPVGNSAAVPALQAEGHEVLAIPTVILSNHPGHGKPAKVEMPMEQLEATLAALRPIRALNDLNAIMTGYFISAAQVIAVAKHIAVLKQETPALHVLVDPVIGDNNALYVPVNVAESIRDHLLPLATITTPNLFELTWLTGWDEIAGAAARLNVAETIVTSVPYGLDRLATRLYAGDAETNHLMSRHTYVPHGTGDFLAGCYLAKRLQHAPDIAFREAMKKLEVVVGKSVGSVVLNLS